MGALANNSTAAYVDWEEAVVSIEKGRREVHYYLKRHGGGRDLVVVGKEKSVRHMTYHYVIEDNKLLRSILNGAPRLKLRSRREVIDWLNSILSGERLNNSRRQFVGGIEIHLDDDIAEDVLLQKLGQHGTEFTWLGSSWTCRKRRMHYQSFYRNDVVISVQYFVYVLAEEGKRLVAYLDDMYEDIRGNKMVVVRWFHKIDEVGFVLPHNYNDREIFFSLCLQDLSIECIDGLATVLSPEHYEKLTAEAIQMGLRPFLCCKLFDTDDVMPFDITRIKGYWKQEIFRNRSSLELSGDDPKSKGSLDDSVGFRPTKRIRWSKESDLYLMSSDKGERAETNLRVCNGASLDCKGFMEKGSTKEGCPYVSLSGQENATPPKAGQYLAIGSEVEVLSQDSGIRGCWFRAVIIKKHKDKVKVQYKDVKDAVDESRNLEEWILASQLAVPDAFGYRLSGRAIVRPNMSSDKGAGSGVVNVGSCVDAWWHDGWWEGIVVKKESEEKLIVYFPEEKHEHVFSLSDLRHSKEWFDDQWQIIRQRPDLVSACCCTNNISDIDQDSLPFDDKDLSASNNDAPHKNVIEIGASMLDSDDNNMPKESKVVGDLSKDYSLARLRWKSSGKRRHGRSPVYKAQFCTNSSIETGLRNFEKFFVNSSLNLDQDNCKYASDSHFNSSVVPSLTNLVMSR